ncbi:putative oxidoreductase [Agrobacterium rubi TR3 = NBRC 13261]|uniref:Putative oxidoreductase n=1 Tax=Agrobacterium rubi TR3 = NBRC 13261 TaxID=1368415 RepID=A0A081CRC6_9HYPH|nr:FAD-dependent oxidoreductase [Agrobacterium rubi]MBP1876972.1 sarcosine oxidase [Agrobacterium rubi]MCL6651158.1 FAD-dependent oxidoreductase [Agrobacterium rubi]GAK69222.1 putative oxidoreductase [Agrobacterium rubi TR3 = NBRC 13261]
MATQFKYIVVGAGMMGAAAARHLTGKSDGVALIGPGEPADIKNHTGVFASHYDAARITRTIDGNADWARLANRSIARYAEIERESGVEFYGEVGCLIVGKKRGAGFDYIENVCAAAETLGVEIEILDDSVLADRFPYFAFESGCEGVFERRNAGWVNPREMVRAQIVSAEKRGVTRIDDIAVSVREDGGVATVTTASGHIYTAEKVIVAAGGFSVAEGLLPQKLEMQVNGRTVAFFEIPDQELHRYAGMPSLIYEPADPRKHIYLLPPVRYPDGKTYLKIGGEPVDIVLNGDREIRDWFRSGGSAKVRDDFSEIIETLIPSIDRSRISMAACVTSYTPSGFPAIGYTASPGIAVLTGGCGAAAKSSDEIGRLGAELLVEGRIIDTEYAADFAPAFSA